MLKNPVVEENRNGAAVMSSELTKELPPKLGELLHACYLRSQAPAMVERLWERFLTQQQRQQLSGDLRTALQHGGVIAMWRRLFGVDENRAIVEVGRRVGGLCAADYEWACRELGLLPTDSGSPVPTRPSWDRDARELKFGGEVIRRIGRANMALNLIRLLDVFEEDGWSSRVDDPLPGSPDAVRLHKAIRSLNRGLTRIKFHADGTGEGVRWEIASMV